jgi:hypothetical protein
MSVSITKYSIHRIMDCTSISNVLSSVSSILAVLLLVSELLPYASSSKCNSILEGASHIMCRTSCLVSNKNIRFDNEELKQKNSTLNEDNKDLQEEINYLKKVVLNDIVSELQNLRKSFDKHRRSKDITNDDNCDEVLVDI